MRIALLGDGTLADAHGPEASFAQLRLLQFHEGLALDGHEVRVLDAGSATRAQVRALAPDVVVSAGTWGPVRAALEVCEDLPLCIDLPGDPFADAQAAAFAPGSAAHAAGVDAAARAAEEVFVPALRRAQAFTTIGDPARFALLGQLGVLGRLARTPPGHESVLVTPIAWRFPGFRPAPPREHRAGNPLTVALVGGFNAWLDEGALLAGLLGAMERIAAQGGELRVLVVGGPIPGHHEAGYARFATGARASVHAGAFTFRPRLPAAALSEALAGAHALAWVDRAGAEPLLGSRTRALLALHQGLRVVATSRCALAHELVAGGWLTPLSGDPHVALTDTLAAWWRTGAPPLPDVAPLAARMSVAATTRALREWVTRQAHGSATARPDPRPIP